jgi:hypothetical protein
VGGLADHAQSADNGDHAGYDRAEYRAARRALRPVVAPERWMPSRCSMLFSPPRQAKACRLHRWAALLFSSWICDIPFAILRQTV